MEILGSMLINIIIAVLFLSAGFNIGVWWCKSGCRRCNPQPRDPLEIFQRAVDKNHTAQQNKDKD